MFRTARQTSMNNDDRTTHEPRMNTMNRTIRTVLLAAIAALFGLDATAQQAGADAAFNLQGRLTTSGGDAVADAQHSVEINIYEAGTNTVVATETDMITTVDGLFSTMVGDNSQFEVEAGTNYEIGISVNGGAELMPRIMIGDVPSAATADVAADAMMVGGFSVGTSGQIGANQIVTTNAQGRIDTNLVDFSGIDLGSLDLSGQIDAALDGNVVTSINGATGNVNLNVNGSGVTLDDDGNGNLTLNITGSGGGSGNFTLPFTGTNAAGSGSTAFSLTSTGAGSAATFINTNTGSALRVRGQATANAVLDVATTAAGGTALRVDGGLELPQAAGTMTLDANTTTMTVNNALVRANSVVMLTVNGAAAIPGFAGLAVTNVTDGAFTVAPINAVAGLTGNVTFNYLIINQ